MPAELKCQACGKPPDLTTVKVDKFKGLAKWACDCGRACSVSTKTIGAERDGVPF